MTASFALARSSRICARKPLNQGFTGVPELLWKLHRNGGKIVECPAILKARDHGQSKMRIVKVSLGHFRLLSQILFQRLFSPAQRLTRQPARAA